MKKLHYFSSILLLFLIGFSFKLWDVPFSKAAENYFLSPNAIQKTNQGLVYHLNSQGQVQSSYNQNSFLVRGLYHTDFGPYGAYVKYGVLDKMLANSCCKTKDAIGNCLEFNCESRDTLNEVKNANFNLIHIAGFYQGEPEELDHAQELGLKVIPYLDRGRYQGDNLPNLEAVISARKDHPAVFAWYLADEPYHKYVSAAKNPIYSNLSSAYQGFQDANNLIKGIDPNHSVFMIESWGALDSFNQAPQKTIDGVTMQEWLNLGDFFASTVYGITNDSTSVEKVLYRADLAKKNLSNKPYIAVIQAMKWPTNPYQWTMPTPAQVRAEIYGSLIHGATGYIAFTQNTPWCGFGQGDEGVYPANDSLNSKNSDVWNEISKVNAEVENLKPIFLAPTSTLIYSVSVNRSPKLTYYSQSPVHSVLKFYNGKFYLITINITNQTVKAKYNFPFRINNLKKINASSNDYSSGSNLYASYNPYQLSIFEFDNLKK